MLQRVPGHSGPARFQSRFSRELEDRGFRVHFGENAEGADALLIIGGSRRLGRIRQAKRSGTPVVQRLNGMNWIHRRRATGLGHYLRAELNNLLLRAVRRIADVVIYQSRFAQEWWENKAGRAEGQAHVVHNGVPLDQFHPEGPGQPPTDRIRISLAEGRFGGGYEIGLEWAVDLRESLSELLQAEVELAVAGEASSELMRRYEGRVIWRGRLDVQGLAQLHRSSHFFFSADLHPACPNSVLESLACGCPVAAFDTGAIGEILTPESGAVVPFGADPWEPGRPAVAELARAASALLTRQNAFRTGARLRAEKAFSLKMMVEGYLSALGWS